MIFSAIDRIGKHRPNLQQDIVELVVKWCEENKMRLSIKKCKILVSYPSSLPNFKINDQKLDVADEYKYLGFNLTSTLDWDQQLV